MIYVQELPTEEDPAQFETKLDRNYPTSAEPLGNIEFGIESSLLFEILLNQLPRLNITKY